MEKIVSSYTSMHHFQNVKKKISEDTLYYSCELEDGKKRYFEFTAFTAKDGLNDELLTILLRKILIEDYDGIYFASLVEQENIRHLQEISNIYSLLNDNENEAGN